MRPRLPFSFVKPTSFVRDDLALLGERFDVRPFHFDLSSGRSALPRRWAEQRRWLRDELPGAAGVFAWFADHHAVLPVRAARRAGIPSVIALGGYDAMRIPSLGYGVFGSTWRAPLARSVLREASALAPVHASLIETTNVFLPDLAERRQGVRAFVRDLATPVETVPTGYEPDTWPMGPAVRAPSVLTVALFDSIRTARRKGLDLFFDAARRLPDVPFTAVGVEDEGAIRAAFEPPENVALRPPVTREALAAIYGAASVYAQFSRAEGMPNVLCEAMLCGCVPVGSRAFGVPAAIGDAGFVVDRPDPDALAGATRAALDALPRMREAARAHVAAHFTREHRRQALFGLFERLGARM